jgi:hypothetical protein
MELGLWSIGWRVSLYFSGITNIAMKSASNTTPFNPQN